MHHQDFPSLSKYLPVKNYLTFYDFNSYPLEGGGIQLTLQMVIVLNTELAQLFKWFKSTVIWRERGLGRGLKLTLQIFSNTKQIHFFTTRYTTSKILSCGKGSLGKDAAFEKYCMKCDKWNTRTSHPSRNACQWKIICSLISTVILLKMVALEHKWCFFVS